MQALVRATAAAERTMQLSRRGFVLSLAAAAPAVLGLKPARAQVDVWREYRPAGLSFRIDMPGEPEVETQQAEYETEAVVKQINATVEYEKSVFGIVWTQWRGNQTIERMSGAQRKLLLQWGPVTRDIPLTINGFPAWEIVGGSDKVYYGITRIIVMGKETMLVFVNSLSDAGVHERPAARRFLDSFKLLRSTP